MSEISCTACQELREEAPEFATSGVTDAVCETLHNDKGFDAGNGNDDETDLHTANDCLIGRMKDEIRSYDVCDWKEFMKKYIGNDYEVNKGIICALGGIWEAFHKLVEALGGGNGYIPVFKHFRFTVPAASFGNVWRADVAAAQAWYYGDSQWYNLDGGIIQYQSGGGMGDDTQPGEGMWIQIPTSEMENIKGVWGQTWVVPGGNSYDGRGKPYVQTVAIQQWFERDGNMIVNFDTHIISPKRIMSGDAIAQNGGPYPVTIDFLVIGERKLF